MRASTNKTMTDIRRIIKDVTDYYNARLSEFGPVPRGVDWNSKDSQELRFQQLLNVVERESGHFTILDYGCGYGALFEFIKRNHPDFHYCGFDSSREMIEQANKLRRDTNCRWTSERDEREKYDYVVASGILNVKLDRTETEWSDYVRQILGQLNAAASKGFAFNILTKYSDAEFMKNNLYYADPCYYFDYCKKHFSRYVSLVHDYPLYEFTILVRKES